MKKIKKIKKCLVYGSCLLMLGNLTACAFLPKSGGKEKTSMTEYNLAYGIYYNRIGMVKEAVEDGADIHHFTTKRKLASTKYDNPLSYARACSDDEIFCYLLEQGATLEEMNVEGMNAGTYLARFSYAAQEAYLELLLENGYNLDLRDEYGKNALDAVLGDTDNYDERNWNIAQILMENGATITSKTVESICNKSYEKGDLNLPRVIRYLVDNGQETGLEEIYEKAILSDSEAVQKLIPRLLCVKEDELRELGYLIAAYCDTETLQLFMQKKSYVDWHETIMIRTASRAGNLDNLKYLIEEEGFVENLEYDVTAPAMEQAESNKHYEVVDYLIQQGYEIPNYLFTSTGWGSLVYEDIINEDRDRLEYCLKNNMGIPNHFEYLLDTALMIQDLDTYKYLYEYATNNNIELDSEELLKDCVQYENPEMIRYLLERREATVEEMSKALDYAVEYVGIDVVQVLLEEGADPNYKYMASTAVGADDIDKIKLLVEYGMDVNYKSDNEIGILLAAAQQSNGVLDYLLEQGIDFSEGSGNETALIHAVCSRSAENVKDLIEAGIDLSVKNEDGRTAYEIAQEIAQDTGDEEIAHIFEERLEKGN